MMVQKNCIRICAMLLDIVLICSRKLDSYLCSILGSSKRRVVFFEIVVARMFAEDRFKGGVLMKKYHCTRRKSTHDPSCTELNIQYTYSSSTVPCTANIHGIFLCINVDSCRLFASRVAVRLHVVAGLQNELAVARDRHPKQTAGKGSFERAVTD